MRVRAGPICVLVAFALGCADSISRSDLLERIQSESPPTIVDVRSRDEFETAHVPGALHVPFYAILSQGAERPVAASEGEPIVVYCEHGPRAGLARAQFWFVTDAPIRFLEGHMTAWKEDGLPVESSEGLP